MALTRRQLVMGCAAGTILPALACKAPAAGPQLTPEAFGAVGDGSSDDYGAFQRMAAAANSAGGGTVALRPGRAYYLGRYIRPGNGVSDVVFEGCSSLTIEGNGATIATKGDYFRETTATRGLAGLRFESCSKLEVRDLQLVGNVQKTRRAAGVTELPSHGLVFGGCSDVIIDRVLARHFAADGLYITDSATADSTGRYRASRRFHVRNSRFLFNARQGMSVIQLRDAVFDGCEFSYTGYVDTRSTEGRYGHHAPSAGVDIEPDATPFTAHRVDVLTGNISFRNCRMIGNFGATLIACQMTDGLAAVENVRVAGCTLETSAASNSQYGLIFDVPGGAIVGCTVRLKDKTAYLGWAAQSRANPKFIRNSVSGSGAGAGQFVFVVLRTRGAPVVEHNRFIVDRARGASATATSKALRNEHPAAQVRDNQFLIRP